MPVVSIQYNINYYHSNGKSETIGVPNETSSVWNHSPIMPLRSRKTLSNALL